MIIPVTKKIMIIPDFGTSAEAGEMLALKEAIEKDKDFSVKIVDLREEIQSEGLKDSQIIEACARRLEELAADDSLRWDNHQDYCTEDPLHDCISLFEEDVDNGEDADNEEDADNGFDEEETFDTLGSEEEVPNEARVERGLRRLRITKSHDVFDLDQAAPDLLVVFGKSAMLAGGVRDSSILFINPEYDSEWPWKKQYYADRDAETGFVMRFPDRIDMPVNSYVYDGVEVNRNNFIITCFALLTDDKNDGEFPDRYPWLYMEDSSIGDNPEKLAEAIREFAYGEMEFPRFEVYEMWKDSISRSRGSRELPLTKPQKLKPAPLRMLELPLTEPLKLKRLTITGLVNSIPMGNGQTGLRLSTEDRSYPIPIEAISDRQELTLLRDAVKKAVDALPPKKRILIVPDYFIPYDAPHIAKLREQLRRRGHYVTVVACSDTLERTRTGIEVRCKKKPFDLIVTLETGCLLAGRVTNAPRIYVNPDWIAWEWMKKRLGDEKELFETRGIDNSGPFWTIRINASEVNEARKMSERSYFRKGGELAVGWFTHDAMDTDLPEEHMKRFNSACYPPKISLVNNDGIRHLAKEIDNFLKADTDED